MQGCVDLCYVKAGRELNRDLSVASPMPTVEPQRNTMYKYNSVVYNAHSKF